MSLASGSRPCFCLSTKASCLAPGFVCLSLVPWFLTQFLSPHDHQVWDLPPCRQSDFWLRRVLHRPPCPEIARTAPRKGAYSDSSALHELCEVIPGPRLVVS
ncbi:hypothetical protein CHARACLAT_027361 [Characodon lateralis]|uniref:Secreted protein n=1 Tax=Characodon lateralis TaxID=208331 RepID=A0ABU7ENZ4_9TELE|nr:hypothetical protein [Characodon lateralis]